MKFKFFLICIGSFFFLGTIISNNIDKENGIDQEFDSMFDPYKQSQAPDPNPSFYCVSDYDILQLITPEEDQECTAHTDVCPPASCLINVPAILKQNIYKYTNGPVKRRSLLDQPSLRDYCLDHCMWHIVGHPFYNWTPRMPFIDNCTILNSYIDLTNKNIVNEIMKTLETTGCSPEIDVPGILGLFKPIKLQQHRAGVMIAACTTFFDILSVTLRAPIYYLAEHYYLTPAEIHSIENAPYFKDLGAFPENLLAIDDIKRFGRKFLIGDRVGLGDTRFDAIFKVYDNDKLGIWFGIATTIPTAKAIKRGLIGTAFNPCAKIPEFSLKKIFNLYLCPVTPEGIREAGNIISEITTEFLLGVIKRMSTILLNSPLGNGGHFGIGPHIDIAYKLDDSWLFHTYAVLEGFTKHDEIKFFLKRKKPSEFDRDYHNEEQARENLLFINRQIINTLYPSPVVVNVNPRYNLRIAESLEVDYGRWHGLIGLDYWYQARETYSNIKELEKKYQVNKNIDRAAQQLKVFLNFGYRSVTFIEKVFWDLEFTGDKAAWSKNLGQDLTVAFRLTLDF